MKRWPFVALGIVSITVSGMIAANEISVADSPVDATVVVATMPPPPPRLPRLTLPRNGLFAPDALAQAQGIQPSPLPLPVLQQNQAQAWAATAIAGVTAVSVAGDSAYAVIQTSGGSLVVRLGDVVEGRKVVGITDCDPPQPGCHAGVMFEGGIFEPVGVKAEAQVPPIGGFPVKAVPVQTVSGTASPSPLPINNAASEQQQRTTPFMQRQPAANNVMTNIHPMPLSGLATPSVINPAGTSAAATPEPR